MQKRSQETDQNQGSVKRLKSAVVVKSIDVEASEQVENSQPRPIAKTSESERGRNRRLLGSLLLGTLNKFKQEAVQPDDSNTKRLEIEKEVEEKVEKDQELLIKKEMDLISTRRQEVDEEMSSIRQSIETKEQELKDHILTDHNSYFTFYAMTKTEPKVYFRPKKWMIGLPAHFALVFLQKI